MRVAYLRACIIRLPKRLGEVRYRARHGTLGRDFVGASPGQSLHERDNGLDRQNTILHMHWSGAVMPVYGMLSKAKSCQQWCATFLSRSYRTVRS